MKRSSKVLLAVLIGTELLMLIPMMLTTRHHAKLYQQMYPCIDPSRADPAQAQRMEESVERAHDASAYRTMDLAVITYHIPVLAMTAILGADWLLPAYMPITVVVYFALGWLILSAVFRNRRSMVQIETEKEDANKRSQATV